MEGKPPKIGKPNIEVLEQGNDISFTARQQEKILASLQCEKDLPRAALIARTIVVEKDFTKQGIGSNLLIEAINYARSHKLSLETDYGISENAEKLIQSLSEKGYSFIKNSGAIERAGTEGKRIVTLDGSPVYILEDKE